MKLYGLIGQSLSHSFSANYFNNKFVREQISVCDYQLFPLQSISELPKLLEDHPNLCGFNVTIPYKKEIFPLLDEVDPLALEVGAVNTVKVILENNKRILIGYNTDVLGFEYSILPLIKNRKKALVLGTGGASMAVLSVMKKLNIPALLVSRNSNQNSIQYQDIDSKIIEEYTIIINTTPVGMFPNCEDAPAIPYSLLNSNHLLFDLVYNPEVTEFLKQGILQGCDVKNGSEMLHIQAEEAWRIWNGNLRVL